MFNLICNLHVNFVKPACVENLPECAKVWVDLKGILAKIV